MALIECHECGKKISSDTKVCPQCGARQRYRPSTGIVVFAILAVIFGIYGVTSTNSPPPKATKTAAELAEDEAKERRHLVVAIAAKKLKNSLREPDSVEWIDMLTDERAEVVCLKYRARNGFGGMSVETLTLTKDEAGQDAALWNRHCAGVELYDMSSVKYAI